jgi:hypothetical protein
MVNMVWETTPQTVLLIAEFLINRVGPRAPTAIHDPLGIKFNPLEKAECLEKQLTTHDLCEENHEWRVEAKSPSSTQSCRQ